VKVRTLVLILILVFAELIIAGSCATGKKTYISTNDALKKLSGTWVNSDYNEKGQMAKVIINPDGTELGYDKETSTDYYYKEEFTITDTWYDPEGNLWIKSIWVNVFNESGYELLKLSNSGKVMEIVWSSVDYPDELSPLAGTYGIYYHQ
jgi:hypothetical protein